MDRDTSLIHFYDCNKYAVSPAFLYFAKKGLMFTTVGGSGYSSKWGEYKIPGIEYLSESPKGLGLRGRDVIEGMGGIV